MRKDSLPRFLGSEFELQEYPVRLPEPDDYFRLMFQKNLAEKFANRSASLDDVVTIISKNPARILVYSRLYSNQWDTQGMKQTDAFFSFWNDFPDLPPGLRLVSCLLITHKLDSPRDANNTEKARTFLKDIEKRENLLNYANRDGKALDNLYAVVLPELESVEEPDVVSWIEGRHFRRVRDDHAPSFCDPNGPVLDDIDNLYKDIPQRRIPMRKLVPQLEQIASHHICKGQ